VAEGLVTDDVDVHYRYGIK